MAFPSVSSVPALPVQRELLDPNPQVYVLLAGLFDLTVLERHSAVAMVVCFVRSIFAAASVHVCYCAHSDDRYAFVVDELDHRHRTHPVVAERQEPCY